jgi:hypothetical protein
MDLANLEGTEKQVTWAGDIRLKKIDEVERAIAFKVDWMNRPALNGKPKSESSKARTEEQILVYKERLELMAGVASAKFWINMKDFSFDPIPALRNNDRIKKLIESDGSQILAG